MNYSHTIQMKPSLHSLIRFNIAFWSLALLFMGCHEKSQPASGTASVDAAHALSTFRVPAGFKIEMVASEPMVADPVDMEIDEYGNLYVVEMHGYPLDKSGSGKIVVLKDTDGDGHMDKRTVFAEGLVLPNGIMRWKKGVLVTDAPNVLYLEDTDGDGVADKKDTILTGFSLSNPHINVNNPVYGLDNWIYLAHRGAISTRNYEKEFGDKGGEVFFPTHPDGTRLPKNADNHSVRFRPDNYKLEMISSKAQFGQTFDEWGHHLLAENGNHAYHEVIANRYLQRNPDLSVPDATQMISDHGKVSEIFPITKVPERQLFSGVGVMTSSSGVTAYLGGIFPAPYNQHITFVCESVSNLVHVDVLKDSGASFVASRVLPNSEFLASTDSWSRPVNMYIGPDGALYVLDYYRQIIEHPEWMSEEAVKAGNLYAGKDMGRIYRISPVGAPAIAWNKGLKLGDATSQQLVEKLSDPNIWWRLNAQRLLVDRADKQSVPLLLQMTKNTNSPMGRLHALWTLQGLDTLNEETISLALKDPFAGIRENAIKIAELHLTASPALGASLLAMSNDADAKVRYQLLLSAGFINTPEAAKTRNALLFEDINDKWVQVAAMTASSSGTSSLLSVVIDKYKPNVAAYASMVQRLTTILGKNARPEVIHHLLQTATAPDPGRKHLWQPAMLEGLAMGMESRKSASAASIDSFKNEQALLVNTFFNNPVSEIRKASLHMLTIIGLTDEAIAKNEMAKSIAIAGDTSVPGDKRAEALSFMALNDVRPSQSFLERFLVPEEQLTIQLAALKTLATITDNSICTFLLTQWPVLTPELRDIAIGIFMANPQRMNLLLDAIQARKIDPASLGWQRTAQLMSQQDDKLRNRARKMLAKGDEEQVNKEYQQALEMDGDSIKGKAVFMQNCGRCHQVRGQMGLSFGPDLGTVHNWLPKNIMANVLSPNLSIAAGFEMWEIKRKSGESVQGIIANETSSAITLKTAPGAESIINRQDIASLKSVNISAMPMGLQKQINQQQMADLIAYLRQNK
ncbi:MAG: PVC-type heme-binding CxxCH protein [Chitinophagaceae bacterium]